MSLLLSYAARRPHLHHSILHHNYYNHTPITQTRPRWSSSTTVEKARKQIGHLTTTATTHNMTRRHRRRLYDKLYQNHHHQEHHHKKRLFTEMSIEVARFGLLCVATLPFTAWIGIFTYDYINRVEICRRSLTGDDTDLASSSYSNSDTTTTQGTTNKSCSSINNNKHAVLLGRDRELAEVGRLLSKDPNQIVVIAGGNEAGKSRFVAEVLHQRRNNNNHNNNNSTNSTTRTHACSTGITYVQLSQLVDSVSSFTSVLVDAFDLRWLRLRHALVDVLPFAGSEILVMKERFGDRDLEQALRVVTEALKQNAVRRNNGGGGGVVGRPVIVIDGLGEGQEGGQWMRSSLEGQLAMNRFLQWCVYVTKERRLAHVVLTGGEGLVLSITDNNRLTRGHVKIVGLEDLNREDSAEIVRRELGDDTTEDEVKKITDVFGGFIHDLNSVARDIRYRLDHEEIALSPPPPRRPQKSKSKSSMKSPRLSSKTRERIFDQVIQARLQRRLERVINAFAKGREHSNDPTTKSRTNKDDSDDMDPFLDPLKSVYSEAHHAGQQMAADNNNESSSGSWTQLQLWKTLQRLVDENNNNCTVPFSELRDDVYDGNIDPILELMSEDVLGFAIGGSSSHNGSYNTRNNHNHGSSTANFNPDSGSLWNVTPASPSLGKAFTHIVNDKTLRSRFQKMERDEKKRIELTNIEITRAQLSNERRSLDARKASLLRTVELGKELGRDDLARRELGRVFEMILEEERGLEERERLLREALALLSEEMDDDYDDGCETKDDDSSSDASDDVHESSSSVNDFVEDQSSIKTLLKDAVFKIASTDDQSSSTRRISNTRTNDQYDRLREAFRVLDSTNDGMITADDVARTIKMTSPDADIDMEAVKALVREWDKDDDNQLDYDEFIQMILVDDDNKKDHENT